MQGAKYSLLKVVCGGVSEDKLWQEAQYDHLEAQSLTSPSVHELSKTLDSLRPNVVYFRGERLANDDIGSLRLSDVNLSTPEAISDLFGSILPTMVYLEIPDGEHMAEAIHTKGVPFVIFWKNSFTYYAASHFAHTLFSVMQRCVQSCFPLPLHQLLAQNPPSLPVGYITVSGSSRSTAIRDHSYSREAELLVTTFSLCGDERLVKGKCKTVMCF